MRRPGARRQATVTVQLESDPALSIELTAQDLGGYAAALARCWSILGISRGDTVAIFDYGSSPVTYLASSAFFPHLQRGAADLLGCLPICSDGVPQMAPRVVRILRYLRPRALFLRPDGLNPFAHHVESEGLDLGRHVEFLVVSQDEGVLRAPARDEWQKRLRVPLYSLLRIDRSLFLAMECPDCHAFHTSREMYGVRAVEPAAAGAGPGDAGGLMEVTPAFAPHVPQGYVSSLVGSLLPGHCHRGHEDQRIAL